MLYCNTATVATTRRAGAGLGAGWAGAGRAWSTRAGVRGARGAGNSRQGARRVGRWSARGAGGLGAGRGRPGRWARAAWALGARAGRAGWLQAVHSVHSACFRSGLTRCYS